MSLELATYNLALLVGPNDLTGTTEIRYEKVAAEVAALDVDVMCLQEIWTLEQVEEIAELL